MRAWMFLLPAVAWAQPSDMGTITVPAKHGQVWLDGALIAPAPLEGLPVTAGKHTVKVCVADDCVSQEVEVVAGKKLTAKFDTLPAPPAKVVAPTVPATYDAQLAAGINAIAKGDLPAALGHLEAAIKLDPQLPAYALLCSTYERAGKLEQSLAACREAYARATLPSDKGVYEKRIKALEAKLAPVKPTEPAAKPAAKGGK